MTNTEKDMILSLRQQKYSFNEIAHQTGLSVGTIKSFLSRASVQKKPVVVAKPSSTEGQALCKHCGLPMTQTEHRKKKCFCSDRCRLLWWNEHRDLSTRSSAHNQVCSICGRSFFTYHGKYCSRACAGKARTRKAGGSHG